MAYTIREGGYIFYMYTKISRQIISSFGDERYGRIMDNLKLENYFR